MINRGLSASSKYKYNKKTGKLEKDDSKIVTIESLSKQANKQVHNLSDIGKQANKQEQIPQPMNAITLITGEDNLIHNYFYDFEYSWDINNCLSVATVKMPRINTENINYWATYQGPVTIYGGYNFTKDKVNNNNFQTEQDAANSLAKYNENSDITPLFRGSVSRIKEYQTYIVIYVDSIGSRFKQKIPDEFRQSYINNQNVRDAFQAICEFLGVDYICPPKTVTESTEDINIVDTTETDGTENDVTKQQEQIKQITDTAKNKIKQSQEDNNESNTNNDNKNESNQTTDEQSTDLNNNQEINAVINGYDDISFDANGALVHGSTAIETSPDMAETLIQMDESPLDKYLDDESGIVEKVQNFLNGDMFEELHNNVMDYGAITIQPKSTASTDISTNTVADTNSSNLSNDSESDTSSESNSDGSTINDGHHTRTTSTKYLREGMGKTKYGTLYLTKQYINNLSPSAAYSLYLKGQKNNTYTAATMEKLFKRSLHLKIY